MFLRAYQALVPGWSPTVFSDRQAKAETPSPPKAGVEAPAVPAAPAPKSEKKDGAKLFIGGC